MDITFELVAFVVFAALIAAVVRMYDVPVTKAAIKPFLLAFGGSLVAAMLTVWMMDASGAIVMNYANFIIVAGASVGGLSVVRAVIEQAKPKSE
jgi:hypothetical protein